MRTYTRGLLLWNIAPATTLKFGAPLWLGPGDPSSYPNGVWRIPTCAMCPVTMVFFLPKDMFSQGMPGLVRNLLNTKCLLDFCNLDSGMALIIASWNGLLLLVTVQEPKWHDRQAQLSLAWKSPTCSIHSWTWIMTGSNVSTLAK